ncbi:MAG TPA: hypothetical protein VHE30_17190 [Polyangiaceae bacterium]|nr:hypothetical protein [Polyangiaceae bacterium]
MRPLAFGVVLVGIVFAGPLGAVTNNPDGSQVPRLSTGGEIQLPALFSSRNDPVDFLVDSHTTPATFSPLCNFKATFVLHQAGSNRGVGWYNVDPNATTPPVDIHVIVPAGTPVGTVVDSATIKGDPAYAGGLIGFALVDGQTHYSESKWNVVCTNPLSCPTPGPWILALTYQSKNTPNAYYLAFEDGTVDAFSFNNDGDYNDDVFFFEGLACDGGGVPCDTGQKGLCASGLTECSSGAVSCKAVVSAQPEKCNALDDDCNGMTDDGDLCPAGQICDRGKCVGRCGSSEFKCKGGKVCSDRGYCVDPACETVTCDEGSVCVAGTCKAACDGITCPVPTVCRGGACIDPCDGVTCEAGKVCSGGVCVQGCDCSPCPADTACDPNSKRCVAPGCAGLTCVNGGVCVNGGCADPCDSAVCPTGQACTGGRCVDVAAPDGGTGDGGGTGVGGLSFESGGDPGTLGAGGAPVLSGGAAGASAGGARAGEPDAPGSKLGCGCELASSSNGAGSLGRAAFGALALAALVTRRARARLRARRTRRRRGGSAR